MSPVTIVGLVLGGLLILASIGVFWAKKEFPAGGVLVTLVGVVLVGMSQWNTIKLNGAGLSLEVSRLREKVDSTAAAVGQVAAQSARAVEATSNQLSALTAALGASSALSPAVVHRVTDSFTLVHRANIDSLRMVRIKLRDVMVRPPEQ